jgi:glutamine synthetase
MSDSMQDFLRRHGIHEVECVITDMTGIARGKILPKDLFLGADHMRLPKSVLLNTVNGEQPNNTPYVGDTDPDMVCVPDPATMRVVPWAACCAGCWRAMPHAAGGRWWRPRWSSTSSRATPTRTNR